jgi:multidrug efflux pump subunit AcrB
MSAVTRWLVSLAIVAVGCAVFGVMVHRAEQQSRDHQETLDRGPSAVYTWCLNHPQAWRCL